MAKSKAVHTPPFALAVKDYLTPPEVDAINRSQYNKHVGDPSFIRAHDDPEVTAVEVVLKDQNQTQVETGAATFDTVIGTWKYMATTDATSSTSMTATAIAHDRPGHTGTLMAMKQGEKQKVES